eukprot:CAMPEP_0197878690 /NCGR_PEP_ID=MMETSP1439-20131203/7000_1 /TAXON_ID=66791 /ORGANISM="Gonyaulax spinifera, Strain CCMP409" /LENGTH=251 /DNA_ID=CAMNT_0043498127 /DNA_START=18 /DNA_END=776 /DNA_ORIENTATION=-
MIRLLQKRAPAVLVTTCVSTPPVQEGAPLLAHRGNVVVPVADSTGRRSTVLQVELPEDTGAERADQHGDDRGAHYRSAAFVAAGSAVAALADAAKLDVWAHQGCESPTVAHPLYSVPLYQNCGTHSGAGFQQDASTWAWVHTALGASSSSPPGSSGRTYASPPRRTWRAVSTSPCFQGDSGAANVWFSLVDHVVHALRIQLPTATATRAPAILSRRLVEGVLHKAMGVPPRGTASLQLGFLPQQAVPKLAG